MATESALSRDPQDCPDCAEYYRSHPHLTGACASVGLEHGLSTEETLRAVLASFHRRGHPAELGVAVRAAARRKARE